ncbi:MAG: SpoIIE family protein phosphatase, partial [bacterium]|nr:SpoIIE family protein phosphatase [bacterium]
MDKKFLNQFRHVLTEHRDALLAWLASDSNSKELRLGGVPIEEVRQVISGHDDVIVNIDSGEFGQCEACGAEVSPELLELDFNKKVCLECYSEEQKRELEKDLELAARVQQQLLPNAVPEVPGVGIAACTEPARVVGGDYFDFFSYDSGAQGFVIADVMGKGLQASMLMSNIQASLRILGPEYTCMHSLTTRLNELFRSNLKLVSFITMFLARLDAGTGVLQYCNAGHNPPLLWEAASGSFQWLKPTGPAIGLTKSACFK